MHAASTSQAATFWSEDVITLLRAPPAAHPGQVLDPLALFGHTHLHRIKPPVLLLSKQVETPIRSSQGPVGALGHSGPVPQPAGVVGLQVEQAQVEDRVPGALEQDQVSQRVVVEG